MPIGGDRGDMQRRRKPKPSRSAKTTAAASQSKSKTKHKTRLSRVYQENEREVLVLLDNAQLAEGNVHEACMEADEVQFFCRLPEPKDERRLKKREELVPRRRDSEEDEQDVEDELLGTPSKTSTEPSSGHGQQTTASTYIHIDVDAEAVLTRQRRATTQLLPDEQLLYSPDPVQLDAHVRIAEDRRLTSNTIRMLNRYQEEAKADGRKLPSELTKALTTTPNREHSSFGRRHATLYRSYCAHKFRPLFVEPQRVVTTLPTRKFMCIKLKQLRFTQHPQSCEEHRIALQLEDAYTEYAQRLDSKCCERLETALAVQRKFVQRHLKRTADTEAQKATTLESSTQCARELEQQLLELREKRESLYVEEAANKALLRTILDSWLQLKQLRTTQEYQVTRIKLRISVDEAHSVEAERSQRSQRFETDLNEIYYEELIAYRHQKRIWKQASAAETSVQRPRKPDIVRLSEELRAQLALCCYEPEEPRVMVQLSQVHEGEGEENAPPTQRKTRSYFLRIYFDGQFVGATRNYRLEPDLCITLNESIGIFLERRLPRDIRLTLYEKSRRRPMKPKKIADILVPLPAFASPENEETHLVTFKGAVKAQTTSFAGRVSLHFKYDDESADMEALNMLVLPSKSSPALDPSSVACLEKPDTEGEHEDEEEEDDTLATATCTFEEDLLQFCSVADVANNKRLCLLHSRYARNDADTRGLRFVPMLDAELVTEAWTDAQLSQEAVIEAGNWMDPIDLHKHEGKKYLKQLYEAIGGQCVRLSRDIQNAEELLIGDEPATWSAFFRALGLLFHPRRPLNPGRDVAQPSTQPLSQSNQSFNIVCNVVRASGIPVRSRPVGGADADGRDGAASSNIFTAQNLKYSNVRPFVVLSYQDKLCRTMTADGSNPTWNEQLILHFSSNLAELRHDLKLTLFDEVVESQPNDDLALRNADIYQRVQNNWLGELRLPISVLLQHPKLEGVFELSTPRVLLGYKRPSLEQADMDATDTSVTIDQYPEIREQVRLWVYLSLEPRVELPRLQSSCLECAELRDVRQQLHEWSLLVRELQPQRFIEPLVCTVEGKRVCLTRLLDAVPLPIETSANLLDSVCRFVALIATFKHYDECMGFRGIWLSNQVLLDTTWGSVKDLGVLLCNYLLTLGLSAWLVLGVASQYGECVFVLYRSDDGDQELIDPYTGRRYATRDIHCPLYKIDYVVGRTNIYCNIQRETRAPLTSFNLNDSSCWLAAFGKRSPAPLGGVQSLNYIYRPSFNCVELRRNIERKIMKKINSWRAMRKTIWNRAFQTRLQNILQALEESTTFAQDEPTINQLAAEFPQHNLFGFTLNFAYTNLTSISERIKATGIYLNSDKNVEFSVAVHVDAYPNNIFSIWIFLLTIVPI